MPLSILNRSSSVTTTWAAGFKWRGLSMILRATGLTFNSR